MTDIPPGTTPPQQTPPKGPPPPLRPAHPVRRTAARAARASVSVIWAVPIIALLVTLALAWNAYAGRGTLVSVAFKDATGITPGETLLKFREITVGQVEAVRFTHDLEQVIVDMRVDKDIAQFIDDDAEFWIVRPQVSTQGISRLDTVLTGAFIEGWWDSEIGTTALEVHSGLERAPLTRSNERGTWVRLAATDATGMSEGAPILYHGLAVGRMQNLRLSEADETVIADVFIEAPHDRRLTTTTVFWDVSGFNISLGTQGLALNVGSLASVLQGGAEFATLSSGGRPVTAGHVFHLQPDRETAQNSLFATSPEDELRLTMLVPEAVRGLPVGADVQFQGLSVGRITNLSVRVSPDDGDVFQDITLAVSPQRMGLPQDAGPAEALEFLSQLVAEQGLRARVAGAGLQGTSLMVELVELPEAPPAQMQPDAEPFPVIPTAPPDLSDISTTAQGLMTRIGKLKLEELLKSATEMMDSVTAIASSQDTRAIPESVRKASDEIGAAAADISAISAELRDSGLAGRIGQALDDTSAAAKAVTEAAADVPSMVEQIEAAAVAVEEFDFSGISDSAKAVVDDLRAMLGSEDAEQLPRNLSDTLQAASALLNDLREGGASGNLNAALQSARRAADQVAQAANTLPALSLRFQQLAMRGETVIASYGERGAFNTETINTMRSLRRAAEAFGSLATTIERNPRAFILGR